MPGRSSFWEKLSIFLTLLITKLPVPINYNEESIIENVNLENYRAVAQEKLAIVLENENAVIKPVQMWTLLLKSRIRLHIFSWKFINYLEILIDQVVKRRIPT